MHNSILMGKGLNRFLVSLKYVETQDDHILIQVSMFFSVLYDMFLSFLIVIGGTSLFQD